MKKIIGTAIGFALPALAFAQTPITNANDIIDQFYRYGNIAINVAISLAVIYIVWGVVKYAVMGADDEEKRGKAKEQVIYGVIGLAIILSIWGLVRIVTNTFSTGSNNAPTQDFPQIRRNF